MVAVYVLCILNGNLGNLAKQRYKTTEPMNFTIALLPINSIITDIIFQLATHPIFWIITGIISGYPIISYLLITQKENQLLKKENQYLIDTFQDIRNPIALAYTPLLNICNNKCPEYIRKELLIIILSMDFLNDHLRKLLGLKKLHINSGKLDVAEYELRYFIEKEIQALQNIAANKRIKLEINTEFNYASAWFDQSLISLAIKMLMTKAINCSKPEATISLQISLSTEYWEIRINDSGNSIISNIYKPYRYWTPKHRKELECKYTKDIIFDKLMRLCEGKVFINNTNHSIILKFPVKCSHVEKRTNTSICIQKNIENEKIDSLFHKTSCNRYSTRPLVILVESNNDFRLYLEACLSVEYTIKSFRDGTEALSCIKEDYPDLVVSDTELYGMSGDELSSRLKTSCKTSIIPLILFSSHIDMDQREKRRNSLADVFLYMPLNIEDLKTEIYVQIKKNRLLRKSLVAKIFGEKFLEIKPVNILNEDNIDFINKVREIILKNLGNDDSLTIKKIASELSMSRTTFFNKWKAITGEPPTYFIEQVRMEKARELLESGEYPVYVIPEMIGLKDVKNFRNKYKEHFGITPKESIKRNNK